MDMARDIISIGGKSDSNTGGWVMEEYLAL